MPVINVSLITGYSREARQRLSQRLTDATTSVIKAPSDVVTIMINEVAGENYMRGKTTRTPGPAHPCQQSVVSAYLEAMQNRDLEKASTYLATDFEMVFPGNAVFRQPQAMVAWAADRYQSIGKQIEGHDVCNTGNGAVVYCRGTLHGVWNDGRKFSDIRFIDRFEVEHDLIRTQLVWNDIGEVLLAL